MADPSSTTPTDRAPVADAEEVWLRQTYRPDAPNLTVRAALVGVVIGAVMCLSNLYVFFKTGWSMGVTLTACILAFAAFSALRSAGLVKRPLGPLENNALTTVASGAGYMTGGGNMAAFGALLMVTTVRPDTMPLILWFGVIAALGVFAAIPIKRQLINKDNLPSRPAPPPPRPSSRSTPPPAAAATRRRSRSASPAWSARWSPSRVTRSSCSQPPSPTRSRWPAPRWPSGRSRSRPRCC